jgi:aminoglycoside phosphotransferase (APT) family kinase protein
MNRRRCRAVLTDALREHPAVKAWTAATSLETAPERIHVFRERQLPRGAVYSLHGLGLGGGAVIAKRSLATTIVIERTIYEEILARLPLTAPHYYGACVNEQSGWIFLEDVGDERYAKGEPEHRELGARWLGTLHVGAAHLAAARSLPDAGPPRYLQHLRMGREKILRSLRTWPFPSTDAGILGAIVSYCDAIEARWARVEAACWGARDTLVHGDFQPKNALLRRDASGLRLCTIDWEMAGFGTPAADLTRIDLRTYWSVVRPAWPEVDLETVDRLAKGGRVLQLLAEVHWASEWLECTRAAARTDGVVYLEVAGRRLAEAARRARVHE